MPKQKILSRRSFLSLSAAALTVGAIGLPSVAKASIPAQPRAYYAPALKRLNFFNTHTNEMLGGTYWQNGYYDRRALRNFAYILRDHRSGDEVHMDAKLFDTLSALQARLRNFDTIEVISGYRSPSSNRMLAARSNGVAKNSYHTKGQAIDIRIPSIPTDYVHQAALSLQAGGVGYYTASDFVHIDTGPVRAW